MAAKAPETPTAKPAAKATAQTRKAEKPAETRPGRSKPAAPVLRPVFTDWAMI